MSQHKLLQSNRPKQLMTKALIFKNNLTKKISIEQQTPPLQTSAKLHLANTNHQFKLQQTKHRLKLKDYLKLNQLSRSKRHSKSKQKQSYLQSNSFLKTQNFRQTFGPQGNINILNCQRSTVKKRSVNNEQEVIQSIQVVQQQLVKTTQKAMVKLKCLHDLIQITKDQNKNYQDLVLLCKVQGLIQQKLLNGIDEINKLFVDHFKAKKDQGQMCLNVKKLLKLNEQQKIFPISPIKLRRNLSIKESDLQKTIKKK